MGKRYFRRFKNTALVGKSRGATFIEVLIAVVVLGLIAATIPPVMVLAVDSQFRQNEMKIAENLTRAEFEYIKTQQYIWGNDTSLIDPETGHYKRVVYDEVNLREALGNYGYMVIADPIDPGNTTIILPPGEDLGVQKITITVYGYRYSETGELKEILETTKYKVAPSLEISGYEVPETE